MTVRMDIFTKAVTSNPQSTQPAAPGLQGQKVDARASTPTTSVEMATIPDLHSVWDSSAEYIEDISHAQTSKRDKLKHSQHYSVVTMVYKSAKCATLLGGLLTVKIGPDKVHFVSDSNVFNHVAAENQQQHALLDQPGPRLLHTESLDHITPEASANPMTPQVLICTIISIKTGHLD